MGGSIIKGRRRVVALSVLNTTYYVGLFSVNAVILKHMNMETLFDGLSEEKQKEVKQYIRNLVIKEEHLSNQIIEARILGSFLPKNINNLLMEFDKKISNNIK